MKLREALKEVLTEDEISKLKTAYDIVGDIAIIEIDDELVGKEKIIAETLLSLQKNVKTVLKKADEHQGTFRTQKMKWIAGVNTKETIHRETNIRLKLDVEKVYFSARLSTERKRIMELVKPGERILSLFSGCAPYPCVIGKNTKAKQIIGIEINPVGHKYGKENIKLNKLKNVGLINGDVNLVLPKLLEKPVIGLKSNWRKEHLKVKLKEKPKLLEIYLDIGDLENYYEKILSSIKELKTNKKYNYIQKIIIHTPLEFNGSEMNMSTDDEKIIKNTIECYTILEILCDEFSLDGFIAHPYTYEEVDLVGKFGKFYKIKQEYLISFLKRNKFQHMILENIMFGPYADVQDITKICFELNIRPCVDLAHMFIYSKTEEEFYNGVEELSKLNPYFHIADSSYLGFKTNHVYNHSLPIGKGKINFSRIYSFIKEGIIEVVSKDELNPIEMIESYNLYNDLIVEKFDRILMPLPKSAEDFLPIALTVAKKGTIIHFYDFLHIDDFSEAEKKVSNACIETGFKYKKIDFIKCGQFSPRTFRVCLDFKIENNHY